jgi:hypothetical protein
LDLADVCGLTESFRKHLTICSGKKQGWTDEQIVMALVLLNLAGGDRYEDLHVLSVYEGFAQVMRRVETHGLLCSERGALERRFCYERRRAVPSLSKVFRYLEVFHNRIDPEKRQPNKAFIPALHYHLQNLQQVNTDMIAFAQQKNPKKTATLDMDRTKTETHKRQSG